MTPRQQELWTYKEEQVMGDKFYALSRMGQHWGSADDKHKAAAMCSMLNRLEEHDIRAQPPAHPEITSDFAPFATGFMIGVVSTFLFIGWWMVMKP